MRVERLAGLLLAALTACGPGIEVRTVVSPDARLGTLRTFRILPVPPARPGRRAERDDPMLVNSVSNQALRTDLIQAFQGLGYALADSGADFSVAFYASAREKLDVSAWDYGYAWRPRWWRGWGPPWRGEPMMTRYTEGTLIVDVIDSRTNDLLWRGWGRTRVSNDQQEYLRAIRSCIEEMFERFPRAGPAERPVAR